MADKYISMRNMRFMLHDVFKVSELSESPYFEQYDKESCDMMLDSAKQLADTYLFPYYESMDRNEPDFIENGELRVHESVGPYLAAMAEAGWLGAAAPAEDGGMQMPATLNVATGIVMSAANNGATTFPALTNGAANLIVSFGTDEQKSYYLPKMFGGEWQGTMALTEPQAGSSLSDITTSATPMPDGSYRIKGQKIYISGGDHDATDNVVHLLLARIDGAAKGTKGISLFIVPKLREENGELVPNDVISAGVFHKLGQKGCPAMHLMYGEKDDCHGYLIGTENQGLGHMFQMMNEARIGVGSGGVAIASAAYYASLQYANERPQGRRIGQKNLNDGQSLIIDHPDVRRMLLLQKAIVEGGMGLVLEAAHFEDLAKISEGEEKENYKLLLELLTPVVKTYPAEKGLVSVSNGVQVLGGGGFCKDFPLENYYRDVRIYPIYEGTTGIQSQDLLGRKITMKGGKPMMLLSQEIQKTIEAASTFEDLKKYVKILVEELKRIQEVTMHLVNIAQKGEFELFLADATLYMDLFGIVVVAWQWLKQATIAKQKLLTENPQGEELAFLESKLHTMKFYFAYEVPKTLGLAKRLTDEEVLTISLEKEFAI